MASDNVIYAKFYSLKPFPDDLKGHFELPTDPYSPDEDDARIAREFLKNLGVVFYQDDEKYTGIVIEPDDGDVPIRERKGFIAYKLSCLLDEHNLRVTYWEDLDHPDVQKKGPFAWLEWNKKLVVRSMSPDRVAFA